MIKNATILHNSPFECAEICKKISHLTPKNHDQILQRLSIRSQVNYLFRAFGTFSLQKKPRNFSKDLISARIRTVMRLIDDSDAIGRPIKDIHNVSANRSINILMHWWRYEEVSLFTLKTRISHLNWLFIVLRQTKTLSASGFISDYNLMSETNRESRAPDLPSHAEIISAFDKASAMDRFVGIQLKLIYFLKLTPAQAISLRPIGAIQSNHLTLTQEGTPKPIKIIGPLNTKQVQIVEEAQALAKPFNINRIRLPEHSATVARYRFYYISKLTGFCQDMLGITPANLAKLR